jgi:hypothetical protein
VDVFADGGYVYAADRYSLMIFQTNYFSGRRGDVNGDGATNVGDVIHLVNFLYRDGPPPVPAWAGDFDCDGATNVGDVVQLVNYLYRDGPPPSC